MFHFWCWSWKRLKERLTFAPRVLSRSKNWVAARIAHLQTAWPWFVPHILRAVATNIIKWPITLTLILFTVLDFRNRPQRCGAHWWWNKESSSISSINLGYHHGLRPIGHNHGLDRNDQKIRNHRQYLPYDYYLYHHSLGHIGKTEGDRSKFFQGSHKVTIFSCWLVDILESMWLRFNMRRSCENLVKMKWQWQLQWQSLPGNDHLWLTADVLERMVWRFNMRRGENLFERKTWARPMVASYPFTRKHSFTETYKEKLKTCTTH